MIREIEQAMLARLQAVADAGGVPWKWRTLTTYPADFEAFMQSSEQIVCPAAWVVFAGWTGVEEWNDGIVVNASFGLLVADENARTDTQARRHGGADPAKEPGSYRLLLSAVASLVGQTLGLNLATAIKAGPARPVAPTAATERRRLSLFAVELNCGIPIALVGDGADSPEELQALHANWDIPLIGDPVPVDADAVAPGTQLPDDAHADATDHVTLETDT
ncbi:MAG: hypothetical protein CVT77_06590 [Alphaproteobacteria bacterium HGW-Alphaproteobacteria-16]|nr:MAG: hypothetical protein CVT77_06590 [Alphaproteobacteria bacterium HGW-Alphaproteobacteria-16]